MIEPRVSASAVGVADHYDELDRWYREIWGEHVHHGLWLSGRESVQQATHNVIARLAERLELGAGMRVCDIGCGYGGTARVLAAEYGVKVTGVTVSRAQHMYAEAKASGGSGSRFMLMDFMENDFEPDAFDTAISIESSEHFADKAALFAEMFRIIRPGGRVGMYAWLARSGAKPWEIRRLLEPICREGRLGGMGTEEEYRGLLDGAGFRDVSFEDYTLNVRRTWRIIVGRMARRLMWDRSAWTFLFSGGRNLAFGKTIFRIRLAYRLGSMRYGLFIAGKPV